MQLLQAWVLLPAVLALTSLGCGLLVERMSGVRLAGLFLVPVGLATVIVLARLAMWLDVTAELATPLVVVAAGAGLWLGRARLDPGAIDRWAAGAALAVFVVFAAPVLLSGSASFAGYTLLGDTSIHFVLIDRITSHGTDVTGLPPSSYRTALVSYFGSGYPLGGHAALGAMLPLVFLDVAWAFQPFLAFVAAALALTIAGLLRRYVRAGWRLAAIAAIAAQPAIVYGYALQGSIKEILTLWLAPLVAALVAELGHDTEPVRVRALLPLAVASAAMIASVGLAAGVWLGPMFLVGLVLVARRGRREPVRVAVAAGAFAVGVLALCAPTLLDLGDYLEVTKGVVTAQEEFGNLIGPVPVIEVFGVWLEGDYRFPPVDRVGIDALELTYGLVGLAAIAGLFGLVWMIRRRAIGPLLFVGSSLLALWYVTRTGSPWADGKAIAIAAPAVLLGAMLGPVALESFGARVEASFLAVLLAGGVLVSNAFVYHDVSLAPHDRLEELADIGDRAAGRGPLLYTEFEEFGKHFLREADPVGATEGFSVDGLSPELATGGRPAFATNADVTTLAADQVARFKLLVQRRAPDGQRPPAGWELEWSGDYYELWRRDGGSTVRAHAKTERTGCGTARRLAREWHSLPDAQLVAAPRPDIGLFEPTKVTLPGGWAPQPPLVQTAGPGRVDGRLRVPRAGDYDVWILGSFGRKVTVSIDGRTVGGVSNELAMPAGWIDLGRVSLDAGARRVAVVREGGSLKPGNGDGRRMIGTVAVSPAHPRSELVQVASNQWRELCDDRYAWVDLVTRG